MKNFLFDPIQFKDFGYDFIKGNDFSYRFQTGGRIIKSIYIPLGPNCDNIDSFKQLLDELNKRKLTKIIIDLPLILDPEITKTVIDELCIRGYKRRIYIQDEETLLVKKENFECDKKVRWYIRKAQDTCETVIKTDLTVGDIKEIYNVYLEAAERIKYIPKDIACFQKLSENCIVALSYNKATKELEGFSYGYLSTLPVKDKNKTILQTIFAGTTNTGMKMYCGYSTYFELIDYSLNTANVDYFDFHGASRTKNRDYTTFKTKFGGEFVALPGSFEKTIYL